MCAKKLDNVYGDIANYAKNERIWSLLDSLESVSIEVTFRTPQPNFTVKS